LAQAGFGTSPKGLRICDELGLEDKRASLSFAANGKVEVAFDVSIAPAVRVAAPHLDG
jgi:hypothetical protein